MAAQTSQAFRSAAYTAGLGLLGALAGTIAGALLWKEHRVVGAIMGSAVLGGGAAAVVGELMPWPKEGDLPTACQQSLKVLGPPSAPPSTPPTSETHVVCSGDYGCVNIPIVCPTGLK